MKLAKSQNVTVLLDGQGADESLAGYHYYYETYLKELQLKDSEKYLIELAAYREFHNPYYLKEQTELPRETKEKLKSLLRPAYRKLFPLPQEKKYLSPDFLNLDFTQQFGTIIPLQGHQGGLKEQLYVNNCVIGLNNLLRFADRNSMAFSREMRLPFLDHHLVEFIFSLPNEFKIHEGWTKYVMRIAMEDILPPEITWRKDKIGYEPPFREWMQDTSIKDTVSDALKDLEQRGIVNKKRKQTGHTDEWNALVVSQTIFS
jgi:asparagine synthase (glutamine-hydrolysing)